MNGDGSVRYALQGGSCVLRFEGAIRYTLGHALESFLDRLFAQGGFEDVVVDLGDAESIDSTGLGLLAKIAGQLRRRNGRKPLVFSPREDINALLASICLDERVVLCERPPVAASEAVPATDPSSAELARTVLNAHKLLCAMNESNRAMFQSVVDAFEQDLASTPETTAQPAEHGR